MNTIAGSLKTDTFNEMFQQRGKALYQNIARLLAPLALHIERLTVFVRQRYLLGFAGRGAFC